VNNKLKQYISCFLLLVLGFTSLPAPLLHKVFANHTDAEENHCHYYHKALGTHVEEQQDHCEIFKANTPLYDAIKIYHDFTSFAIVVSEYKIPEISIASFSTPLNLPARAPPVA
jgi:hypothetical protein